MKAFPAWRNLGEGVELAERLKNPWFNVVSLRVPALVEVQANNSRVGRNDKANAG